MLEPFEIVTIFHHNPLNVGEYCWLSRDQKKYLKKSWSRVYSVLNQIPGQQGKNKQQGKGHIVRILYHNKSRYFNFLPFVCSFSEKVEDDGRPIGQYPYLFWTISDAVIDFDPFSTCCKNVSWWNVWTPRKLCNFATVITHDDWEISWNCFFFLPSDGLIYINGGDSPFAKNSETMHGIEKILVRNGTRSANEYINYCALTNIHLVIFTARKRCLGQGNVFTTVCHSVHEGRGLPRQKPP